jgi:hypothetical protein
MNVSSVRVAATIFGMLVALRSPLIDESSARAQGVLLPRAPDGRPDLSGIWQALNTAAWDIQDHGARQGVPAGIGVVEGNDLPYQPWAVGKKRDNFAHRATADPETKCFLPGVPRITYMPFPFQVAQAPNHLAFLYEYAHATRIVYTDGTSHPKGSFDFWMGDSRGHWDGDALIVDVADLNPDTWFDRSGNFHSEALHVIERYRLVTPDHMSYEVTIDDPKVFTKAWKMSMPLYRRKDPNPQLLEFECQTFDVWPGF